MAWSGKEIETMSSLYIRFVSGKGWDSKLIEWYSRCEWSHVEFLIGNMTFGAQLKGGLRIRSIKDGCYAKAAKYAVWQIPITDDQQVVFQKLLADANGTKYDWPAILSFILGPHRWHLNGRYICSGFEAGVLKALQLLDIDFPIENYSPRDIWMLVPQIKGAARCC